MSSEKIDTRSKILATTRKLLEAGDGNKVRMADIAKATGISRQAVYLHFPNRADLLIAVTQYIDEVEDADRYFSASRSAKTGKERVAFFIEDWGNYAPIVYGVAKALMAMMDDDEEAAEAWNNRLQALRHGCEAAITALVKDGDLNPAFTKKQAVDFLWTLTSLRNWEQLTQHCGWSQKQYLDRMKLVAASALVKWKGD